ncbi:MAG: TauD/TfdA family dioxygenase [Rickettsiales bacterium]
MTLEFKETESQFAYEVSGTPIWSLKAESDIRELDQALSAHGVLIFRRQSISEQELVDFSARFGPLDKVVRTDWASTSHAEITRISNMRNADGNPIGGLGSGDLDWHSDQSYMPAPATGAILQGVEVPEDGPQTYWANLALAYAALPEATKRRIDGKRGIFSYAKRVSKYDQEKTPEEVRRKTPDVTHLLVNRHPVTGTSALYLDPATTIGIEGLPEDEGQELLDELAAHAAQPAFVYRHDWQVGDVVMWDNGFMLHRRDAFGTDQNRLLKRTTIRLSPNQHIIPS